MADTRRKISPRVGQLLVWERGVRVFLLPTFGKRIAPLCLFAMVSAKVLVKDLHILGIVFKAE